MANSPESKTGPKAGEGRPNDRQVDEKIAKAAGRIALGGKK
jgi:hypothetical protein